MTVRHRIILNVHLKKINLMKITGTIKTTAILIIVYATLKVLANDQSNDFERVVYILFHLYRWMLVVIGILALSEFINREK